MPSISQSNILTFRFISLTSPIKQVHICFHTNIHYYFYREIIRIVKIELEILEIQGVQFSTYPDRIVTLMPTFLNREKELLESEDADTVFLEDWDKEEDPSEPVCSPSTSYFQSPKHSGSPTPPTRKYTIDIIQTPPQPRKRPWFKIEEQIEEIKVNAT